ncbi:NADH dehydrogenase (quinone) [Propionibacterium ruminifibrarum]|uniref:NADH-quinone oxidoreductase subunit C n=1 Tax=Propionibacterium ruminifibrarum TaxID=1962131 RepID=A0A375I1Z2_9ACTN|nr:NADH-quinone oxidoreductase subunit C [Propionibacterium ruminifibrarum]SPF68822.1 NADH dehydrogenase (quinone) [Propionibacterium ruminifibrarum]
MSENDATPVRPERSEESLEFPYLAQLFAPGADPEVDDQIVARRTGMWGSGQGSGDTSGFNGLERTTALAGITTPPFGGWFDQIADRMAELVPGFATHVMVHRGEITFFVLPDKLVELCRALRDDEDLRFEVCPSVSGVHYPEQTGRELHVVYHLLSYTYNRRIRLEVELPDSDPHVPSVVPVYPHANYHERETWDMFGVVFDGHPGLTRILMPDDWVGHPQRKDYPLGGIPVEFKGAVVAPPSERRSYNQ